VEQQSGACSPLGLCPLLAVTSTATNGLGLELATLVMINLVVLLFRCWKKSEIRIPMFVLIITCLVTAIELLMSAHLCEPNLALGIFLPHIATNCAVIGA
jgi:electron transport complex protein RnfE